MPHLTGAARAEFDKRRAEHAEHQRREKERRTKDRYGRKFDPGPEIDPCTECGRPASFSIGDFGRPTDKPEHFCFRHLPAGFLPSKT